MHVLLSKYRWIIHKVGELQWAIPLNKHTPPVDERYLQFNPLDMADPSNPPGQPQNTPLDN